MYIWICIHINMYVCIYDMNKCMYIYLYVYICIYNIYIQGHPGTWKLADRNRSLEFGRFLALCFRNPLAAILAVSE